MESGFRHNLPAKAYAVKRVKPRLRRQVEETLSNKHEELIDVRPDDTTIDTYYIHSKDTFYQGNWMGGLPHGKGNAIYPDGTLYYGKFDEGEAEDGRAFLIFPNGAFYQGEVHKSKLSGKGKLIHKLSYRYQGDWYNSKPHGKGRQNFDDGSQYIGLFKNGLKHCFDENRTIKEKKENAPNMMSVYKRGGEVYYGEFKEGLMHGYGELTNKLRQMEYYGEFVRGKKEGYGTLKTEHGRLTGHFENDLINGEGTFQWYDGRCYQGSFERSQFHGPGKITYPEGNSISGTWKDGQSENLKKVFGKSSEEVKPYSVANSGYRNNDSRYNNDPSNRNRAYDSNNNNRSNINQSGRKSNLNESKSQRSLNQSRGVKEGDRSIVDQRRNDNGEPGTRQMLA